MTPDWLTVHKGRAPLVVSIPHAGVALQDVEPALSSAWLARKDADWWIPNLYAFAAELGASVVRTEISRTVIDMNRDPSGASLYPGQTTTGLCPHESFDGEPLYRAGQEPDALEVDRRIASYFKPYHNALAGELDRLKAIHPKVVLYDAHSIRSRAPRLFEGLLPQFNIGTNDGASCSPTLQAGVETACERSGRSFVVNGRFKGGWITRHYGEPERGVHAVQMELACRGYMDEPDAPLSPDNWPTPFIETIAAPLQETLGDVLNACLAFARS